MKVLLPAVACLALMGLPALATPAPMLAQASRLSTGVALHWTPPGPADQYIIERSRAGTPFTAIASVSGSTSTYIDLGGQDTDLYIVEGTVSQVATYLSNPTAGMLDPSCPWVTQDTPPELNCSCFPSCP